MPRRTTTTAFDAASYLTSNARVEAYLDAVIEEGDPQAFAAALGTVARARGMGAIARHAGMGRESLYKALSADGNPGFGSVLRILSALGYTLTLKRRGEGSTAGRARRNRA
jgi:probable addiction module antidote protein